MVLCAQHFRTTTVREGGGYLTLGIGRLIFDIEPRIGRLSNLQLLSITIIDRGVARAERCRVRDLWIRLRQQPRRRFAHRRWSAPHVW